MGKTIVVGYDDKEPAKRALERAIREAKAANAELVVVSVLAMPLDPEGPQNFGTLDDSPARMIPLVEPPELEPALSHARQRVEAAGVKADFVWAVGEPADAIVTTAQDHRAQLIVLGAHHHGFFGRMFGS